MACKNPLYYLWSLLLFSCAMLRFQLSSMVGESPPGDTSSSLNHSSLFIVWECIGHVYATGKKNSLGESSQVRKGTDQREAMVFTMHADVRIVDETKRLLRIEGGSDEFHYFL
jgi:hypothetical protein